MIYRGKVTANNSPTRDGRVQVRIFEIHDENVKDSELPWAEVMQGIDFIGFFDGPNGNHGYGKNTIIEIGTWVFCILDHDNPNMPIVIGTVSANNEINDKSNPKNQVTRTVSGHLIEIDDNNGNERIHIHHKSGTDIEIKPDGTVQIHNVKDVNIQTDGTNNETVTQKCTEKYNAGQDTDGGPSVKIHAGRIDLN